MNPIVVSGFGIASSVAMGAPEFLSCASNGSWEQRHDREDLFERAGALFTPEICRRMDEHTLYGLLAAAEACAMAGIPSAAIDPSRLGTVLATLWGPMQTINQYFYDVVAKGPAHSSPFLFPYTVTNAVIGGVARLLGCKGASSMLVGSCPVAYACDLIRNGKADIVVAGGVENIARFYRLYAPARAREFLFEGAGVVVLESEASARLRGVPILARIHGQSQVFLADLNDHVQLGARLKAIFSRAIAGTGISAERIQAPVSMFDGDDHTEGRALIEAAVLAVHAGASTANPRRPFAGLNQLLGPQSVLNLITGLHQVKSDLADQPALFLSTSCRNGGNISALMVEGAPV